MRSTWMRHWPWRLFRFRLRGLLVLLTLASVCLGWFGYQLRAGDSERKALRELDALAQEFGGQSNGRLTMLRASEWSRPIHRFVGSDVVRPDKAILIISVTPRFPDWLDRVARATGNAWPHRVEEVYVGRRDPRATDRVYTLSIAGPISCRFEPPDMSEEGILRRFGKGVDDRVIEPLMALESPERIVFDGSNVSADAVERLRRALPSTEVLVIEPPKQEN